MVFDELDRLEVILLLTMVFPRMRLSGIHSDPATTSLLDISTANLELNHDMIFVSSSVDMLPHGLECA
jgi:hypothetical protein